MVGLGGEGSSWSSSSDSASGTGEGAAGGSGASAVGKTRLSIKLPASTKKESSALAKSPSKLNCDDWDLVSVSGVESGEESGSFLLGVKGRWASIFEDWCAKRVISSIQDEALCGRTSRTMLSR